jgi:hypothetical protein
MKKLLFILMILLFTKEEFSQTIRINKYLVDSSLGTHVQGLFYDSAHNGVWQRMATRAYANSIAGGGGTVTSVSTTNGFGVLASVANPTTTPNVTIGIDSSVIHSSAYNDGRYTSLTRTLTINGSTQDLSVNRTWNVGSVTSVGLSLPVEFNITNSPVTTTGILTGAWANQTQYKLFGRGSGTGVPSFLPSIDSNWIPTLHSKPYYDGIYQPIGSIAPSLANFYLKDSALSSDRTVDLNGYNLEFVKGSNYLAIFPIIGNEIIEFSVLDDTGGGNKSIINTVATPSQSTFTIFSFFNDGESNASIVGHANPVYSTIEYDATTHTFNGNVLVSTLNTSGSALVTTGTRQYVLSDANGLLSFIDKSFSVLTYSTTITHDVTTGFNKTLTLAGDAVITLTNNQNGDPPVTYIVNQDAGGGHNLTVGVVIVPIDPAPNAVTTAACLYDGANLHCASSYVTPSVTSVSGTTNRITSTGGLTPVIDISASYVGQSSITTLGTVTSGGLGTGAVVRGVTMTLGSDATGDTYYRNSSGILTRLGVGTSKQTLHGGTIPQWLDTTVVGASGITIGTTAITSGTNGRVLYDNSGIVGEMTTSGSGTQLALTSAPTLTNPVVGTQATSDNSTKAASTAYVTTAITNAIAAVNPAVAVQAATTSASNTSGLTYFNGVSGIGASFTGSVATAITFDGFTFTTLGQRALIKNDTQSPSGAFNGVYYVTQVQTVGLPPILTRALDYDQSSDINNTGAIPVINGTVNANTSWLLTSTVNTVGTDPLTYVQFSYAPSALLLDPGSNGILSRTSANTVTPRTITGTTNDIGVTNGDGVSGNPTLDIGSNVVTLVGTQILTNKRITARYGSTTSSGTPTINTDNVDIYELTAQAVNITSMTTNLSGTPTTDQVLHIAITTTGTITIAMGASFEASSIALPTGITGAIRVDYWFMYTAAGKWRIIGSL